jgi:endonuclease III
MPSRTAERFEDRRARSRAILRILKRIYPQARCSLDFENPFQLYVATVLSAQCTDERVNKVTPVFFQLFPSPSAVAAAPRENIEEAIRSTGFYRNKAKNIQAAARRIIEEFGGAVPDTLEQLTTLPGVGRKTANVILGNCFDTPGITVDTHVGRIARRLELSGQKDPVKVEFDLMDLIPKKDWTPFSHMMIAHGRACCTARKPDCPACDLRRHCPFGQAQAG